MYFTSLLNRLDGYLVCRSLARLVRWMAGWSARIFIFLIRYDYTPGALHVPEALCFHNSVSGTLWSKNFIFPELLFF